MKALLLYVGVFLISQIQSISLKQQSAVQNQWGFTRNIINIESFFKTESGQGKHHKKHDINNIDIDDGDDDEDEKKPKQLSEQELKKKREEEAKEQLKKVIEKEAAEKAVEAMMVGLDEESFKGSQEKENTTAKGNETVKLPPQFNKSEEFAIVYSSPSKPDEVKLIKKILNNSQEVQDLYDQTPGLKMVFTHGKIYKSNIHLEDNELEYYRLIGEAYNSRLLDRQKVPPTKQKLIKNGVFFVDTVNAAKKSNSTSKQNQAPDTFYTYVIKGIPQTLAHNDQIDVKYGYSKQVFVGSGDDTKLFSTSCNHLKFNDSEQRLKDCRLASGYFIVNQAGLFKKVKTKTLKDVGIQLKK